MKKNVRISLAIFVIILVTAGNVYSQPKENYQNDGAKTTMKHYDKILDQRYVEIFIVGADEKGNTKSACYNTIGYNDINKTGDTSPGDLVSKVSIDQIKQEYKAVGAFINGPRRWCLDWIDIPTGTERNFNGLKAAWVATLRMSGKTPYKSMQIERKSAIGMKKGTTVFLLDDNVGNTWVMKSYSLVLDPTMTMAKVPAMLAKLKLPAGWSYRVKVLDKDLTLVPESGVATIVPDDLDNMYDITGPGFSNYKP
jgi:hypothetical protein